MSCKKSFVILSIIFALARASFGELVAYLDFNDSPSLVIDKSGNGRNGILYGPSMTTRVAGMTGFGTAATFNGSSDYLIIPYLNGPFPSYTISWWMKPASLAPNRPSNWNQIIQGNPQPTFFCHAENNGGWYMGTGNDVGRFEASQSVGAMQVGVWAHHLYTYDGKAGTGSYYNNGVLKATGSQKPPLVFDNLQFGNASTSTMHGAIDDISFYDEALGQTSVTALATKTRTPLNLIPAAPKVTPTPYPTPITSDRVLLGMHFVEDGAGPSPASSVPEANFPWFGDYVKYMPDDLKYVSYADFWRWWYNLERYKGDEQGMQTLDTLVAKCLELGIRVKIDLAQNTWFTLDNDWPNNLNLGGCPPDADDFAHTCAVLARRYKGKILLWELLGEANDVKGAWNNAPITHVHDTYKKAYRALKQYDPNVMASISGATPSFTLPDMNDWIASNALCCKGYYDEIGMNYFADVPGADPYNGLSNFYGAIKRYMDMAGMTDAQVGSGESSTQYLLDSYNVPITPPPTELGDPNTAPNSELKQAWRMNESMGTFFTAGGNRFMWWGTEFAPGYGWPWRWGFRKYQDWWRVWPSNCKIGGTNIVYKYNNPDGRTANISPAWSRPTDPYHPVWQTYKFWSGCTPAGADAIRLPLQVTGNSSRVLNVATYLESRDEAVVLMQRDDSTAAHVSVDMAKTGWADGTHLNVQTLTEDIDLATGDHTVKANASTQVDVASGKLVFDSASASGYTTISIKRPTPEYAAEFGSPIVPAQVEIGKGFDGMLMIRNSGSAAWDPSQVVLAQYEEPSPRAYSESKRVLPGLTSSVAAGTSATLQFNVLADSIPGRMTRSLRLYHLTKGWFGPIFTASTEAMDLDAPRKLVVLSSPNGVRVKWFTPPRLDAPVAYEVYRSTGFDDPMALIQKMSGTELIDQPPLRDRAYYYEVVAVRNESDRSRPTVRDNGKWRTTTRLWDAEISCPSIPTTLQLGKTVTLPITIRNTGSKIWVLTDTNLFFYLNTTQQWGSISESLPRYPVPTSSAVVFAGQAITLNIPYKCTKAGRFENHWILCMDVVGKQRNFIGNPLLVETAVYDSAKANEAWVQEK